MSSAHDRVQRGLVRLRARLDGAHGGDRRAWALGLLPLARAPHGLAATALGGIFMSTAFKLAASVVIVGGAVGIWVGGRAPQAALSPEPRVAQPETPAALAVPERSMESASGPAATRTSVGGEPEVA